MVCLTLARARTRMPQATSFLYTPACAVLFTGASFGAVKFWGTATKLANEENERDGYGQ